MNDLKLHICSNVSYWMGSWDDGWVWGCLPDELSSTKNPESIFLSTPKKGEAGPSSAGTTDFLSDFVSFNLLSDYQIIFLILAWGSHFLSEFLLSSDFPILILFLQFSFNLQGRGGRAPGGKTDLWLFASSLPNTGNGYYWHITSGRGKFIPFL